MNILYGAVLYTVIVYEYIVLRRPVVVLQICISPLQVVLYAVTCSDEETSKRYLLDIASSKDRVLKLTEYKTIGLIKSAIQGQQCLSEYCVTIILKH